MSILEVATKIVIARDDTELPLFRKLHVFSPWPPSARWPHDAFLSLEDIYIYNSRASKYDLNSNGGGGRGGTKK